MSAIATWLLQYQSEMKNEFVTHKWQMTMYEHKFQLVFCLLLLTCFPIRPHVFVGCNTGLGEPDGHSRKTSPDAGSRFPRAVDSDKSWTPSSWIFCDFCRTWWHCRFASPTVAPRDPLGAVTYSVICVAIVWAPNSRWTYENRSTLLPLT